MIRRAQSHEAALLSELAVRSKAHWGYPPDFLAACREELRVRSNEIEDGRVFVFDEGGRVLGFYSLEPVDGTTVELGHLFVEPDRIGRGLGGALVAHVCAEARARGGRRLLIQGDPHAEDFYRAMGAQPIGRRESASIPGRLLPLLEIVLDTRSGALRSEP